MAQLVKIYDYISRYESNPFHYPSQYIRLKQDNWRKLQARWKMESLEDKVTEKESQPATPKGRSKWNPFKRNNFVEQAPEVSNDKLPKTEQELKQLFLNQLYPVQMKWATSTISQESFTNISYEDTKVLKYFLQRFPDIYLLMYYPVFNIKNAPIDGEIILISPFEIEVISLINRRSDATIIATDDRKWTIETDQSEKTIISPVISLKRTEQIIKNILQLKQIEMPIKKSIVSQNNHILYSAEPYQTNIITKRTYESWFETKRKLQSPLKSIQLKAMEALLERCQTTSVRRPEWKSEQDSEMSENHKDY